MWIQPTRLKRQGRAMDEGGKSGGLAFVFVSGTGAHGYDARKDHHQEKRGSYKQVMHGSEISFLAGGVRARPTRLSIADDGRREYSTKGNLHGTLVWRDPTNGGVRCRTRFVPDLVPKQNFGVAAKILNPQKAGEPQIPSTLQQGGVAKELEMAESFAGLGGWDGRCVGLARNDLGVLSTLEAIDHV